MKKNICFAVNIKELHIGNSLKTDTLQGNYSSSALQGKFENSFEATHKKKMKIIEVYGDKPIDEVLQTFSKYIAHLGGSDE